MRRSNTSKADCITALRLLIKDLESRGFRRNREFGLEPAESSPMERNEEGGVHTILTGYDDFNALAHARADPRNALFVSELLRSRSFSSERSVT